MSIVHQGSNDKIYLLGLATFKLTVKIVVAYAQFGVTSDWFYLNVLIVAIVKMWARNKFNQHTLKLWGIDRFDRMERCFVLVCDFEQRHVLIVYFTIFEDKVTSLTKEYGSKRLRKNLYTWHQYAKR